MTEPPTAQQRINLGASEVQVSPMGIGTWAWGDRMFWGYERSGYTFQDVQAAFEINIQAGINFFDTAEVYGLGKSEKIVGQLTQKQQDALVIATKFFPFPWRVLAGQMGNALRRSLKRLQTTQVGLYQIHWPRGIRPIEFWVAEIGKLQHAGLTRAVGVSNYDTEQTRAAAKILAAQGIPLASNQVPYHLLDRKIEKSGLLDFCQEQNISIIAYSPLAQGLLTGKYSPDNPPSGSFRMIKADDDKMVKLQKLIDLMREIGSSHGGKTPAQIALNWTICKGTIPIPGAKNAKQASENLGALGWSLTPEEVAALDKASDQFS